jgi:UDP-glucose 4-epimerase
MPSRRALITGAQGFIGRHLARRLASEGWEVTGVGHGHWPREEWSSWGLARWNPGNVDLGTLSKTDEQDVAFHCAGGASVRFAAENPHEDFARSVESTAALLQWARERPSRPSIVMVSSAGVYGNTGSEPVREDRAPSPESVYAVHKRMAEELSRMHGRFFGTRCAIVRLFSVYGPGLEKQLLWDACNKLTMGEVVFSGTGEEARDWVNVRDAAALLALAADRAGVECPVVNGGAGHAVSIREVLAVIAGTLGRPAPSFSGQVRAGDPDRLVADPSRAHAWGWRPTVHWRDGVAEYCRWFTARGGGRS